MLKSQSTIANRKRKTKREAQPFMALLSAGITLAMATLVGASSSPQVEELNPLAVPRTAHAATALADGRVLITGGVDASGTILSAAEIFDPATKTSTAISALAHARVDHSATLLADGRVLIAGGSGANGTLTSAEVFDPAAPVPSFRSLPAQMGAARARHTATLLNNGTVLVAGGDDAGTAEIFDPTAETFSPSLLTMTTPRTGHTATLFSDNSVLLAGGNTDSMEFFSSADQKFTLDPQKMSAVRTGHEALALSDTRLLLFGGDTGNTIDEFNPSADTLSLKATMNGPMSSATLLANGKILVLRPDVAGIYAPDAVDQTTAFTPFDEVLLPGSNALQRKGETATELSGDKKILVAGGVNAQNQPVLQIAAFNPARIWTDKDDYIPDEPVLLFGSGWRPNEDVYLYAVDSETEQWTYGSTATADTNGSFAVEPYFIVQMRHLGTTFDVSAVGGQSNMQADVTFTDSTSFKSIMVGAQTGTAREGTSAAPTYDIAVGFTGNGSDTVALTFAWTGTAPAGIISTTFVPTSVTGTSTSTLHSTLTITTDATTRAGNYTFTVTGNNGSTSMPSNGTLTVAAKPATSLAVSSANGTFGGTASLSATLTSGGSGVSGKTITFTLNGNSVGSATTNASGLATLANASLSGINAGTYPTGVGASFAGDSSLSPSSGTASLTVGKATPTVTVTGGTFTYDANQHAATATAVGLDGHTVVSGNFAFTYTPPGNSTAPTNASATPYSVSAAFTSTDPNYSNTSGSGSITINKATPTITWSNPADINYGTALSATQLNATASFNNNPVPGNFVYSPAAGTVLNAGNAQTLSVTFTPTDTTNFSTANKTAAINVLKATPTINWSNPTDITYGTALSATQLNATASSGGNSVPGNFAYTPALGTVLNAGSNQTLSVTFTPTDTSNFNTASKSVSINVTKAHLSVTADDKSRAYGAVNPTFTATITGFINGDTTAVVSGSPAFTGTGPSSTATTAVGDYVITPALGTLSATNYDFTPFVAGALHITKAHLTVSADDKSRAYGAGNPTFTATITGFANGETAAVVIGSPIFSGTGPSATVTTAVGNYVITPALGTLSATNYDFPAANFVNGTLIITKAHLTVKADDKSKSYDGAVFSAFTTTITGFANSETSSVVSGSPGFMGSAVSGINAGTYNITPTAGSLTATNYDFPTANFVDGTLTISKVHVTVTADDKSKGYDGAVFSPFTVTIVGFVNNETTSVVSGAAAFTGTAATAINAGTYTITPTAGTLSATNYDFTTFNPGTLTISKAHLTVKADDKSKTYDGAVFNAFTATITGFVNNETSSVVSGAPGFMGNAISAINGGTYTIIPAAGSLAATN